MARSNSINERTNSVEAVELFITETLLKKGKIMIPDFGHLELKSLGDRRTVFFKQVEGNKESFLQLMSSVDEKDKKETDVLYAAITTPLKAEKVVNLPQVGIFRPVKRDDKIHVSYIPSAALRKLLNGGESAVKEEEKVKEVKEETEAKEEKTSNAQENNVEVQKDEITIDKTIETNHIEKIEKAAEPLKKDDIVIKPRPVVAPVRKKPDVGDTLVPQDVTYEKSRSRNISGTLLVIVVVIVIVVVAIFSFFSPRNNSSNNKNEVAEQTELSLSSSESNSLPSLAEKYYGHPAFWVYIYDANSDKLNSPINIPKNVSLVIPDLKTEYGVDVTDSVEIREANNLSEIFLTQIKNNKINN